MSRETPERKCSYVEGLISHAGWWRSESKHLDAFAMYKTRDVIERVTIAPGNVALCCQDRLSIANYRHIDFVLGAVHRDEEH